MNIRRYVAPDMRTAFKLVRDELGPDVVILSTRRVRGQIELTVASDQAASAPQPTLAVKEVTFPTVGIAEAPVASPIRAEGASVKTLPKANVDFVKPTNVPSPSAVSNPGVNDELRALRRLLETQLASLSWNDLSRRSPAVAEIVRELTDGGFSKDFITSIIDSIPDGAEFEAARAVMTHAVESSLITTGDLWTEKGGTIAMVGPAGAGKTTALAALAARWVMHNGTQGAVLISAGESRFGAHENLARVGRLVGLPVHTLSSLMEVPSLLNRLVDRRLVLIDTAGCGPRSEQFDAHIAALSSALPSVQFGLALSAASQPTVVREVVAGYRKLGKLACILSHVDECTSIGGTLSALIENRIPIAYTMTGPRLLDDLRPARPDTLISWCVASSATSSVGNTQEQAHVA